MKQLLVVSAFIVLGALGIAAEDLTGKWSGAFTGIGPDGNQMTETLYLDLVQQGTNLTGTAGPSVERQWQIKNGKIDGDKTVFDVQGGGDMQNAPVLHFSLAYADGHLKGDVQVQHGEMKLSAKVDVARVK